MSYTTGWQIPDRVIFCSMGEVYDMEDANQLNAELLRCLDQSTMPLHILINISHLQQFPKRLNEETMAMAGWLRHKNLGWLIIINEGTNPMAHLLVTVVGKTIGVKSRFVKTCDEALATVLRTDPSLSTF